MYFTTIGQVCNFIAKKGFAEGSSGNVSQRMPGKEGFMQITERATWFEFYPSERTGTPVNIHTGEVVEMYRGELPSTEWKVHAEIYKRRPDINAIIHCQSPCATTLACFPATYNMNILPEFVYYNKKYRVVPYYKPGTDALAIATGEAFAEDDVHVVQMRNHGQVTGGADLDDVVKQTLFFEINCRTIIQSGLTPERIPEITEQRGSLEAQQDIRFLLSLIPEGKLDTAANLPMTDYGLGSLDVSRQLQGRVDEIRARWAV